MIFSSRLLATNTGIARPFGISVSSVCLGEYAPGTGPFPARNSATIKLTHYPDSINTSIPARIISGVISISEYNSPMGAPFLGAHPHTDRPVTQNGLKHIAPHQFRAMNRRLSFCVALSTFGTSHCQRMMTRHPRAFSRA